MGGRIDLGQIFADQAIPQPLKNAIDGVSRLISNYFIGVQANFPNTLMYGRKKECWTAIKNLRYGMALHDIQTIPVAIDFFPVNPALTYIQDSNNINRVSMWESILTWNESAHVFSKTDTERLRQDIIVGIRLSGKILVDKDKNFAKTAFLKAVQNGFLYR